MIQQTTLHLSALHWRAVLPPKPDFWLRIASEQLNQNILCVIKSLIQSAEPAIFISIWIE
jgi:hypothetical protein